MDKKKDIIQAYRQKKDEFRLPLQQDSWEKLEAALSGQPKRSRLSSRFMAIAAVAFIFIVVSFTFLFTKKETHPIIADIPFTGPMGEEPALTIPTPPLTGTRETVSLPAAASKPLMAQKIQIGQENPIIDNEVIKENTIEQKEEVADADKKSPPTSTNGQQRVFAGPEKNAKTPVIPSLHTTARNARSHWSWGLASGTNNFSAVNGGISDMRVTAPGPGEPEEPEDPPSPPLTEEEPIPLFLPIQNDYYKHDIPLSVSFSIRRYLTSKLAFESGVTYTYLHADITRQNEKKGDQNIHYLGVPLKLNWEFVQKGPLSLYVSGGGMAEYCLSARKNGQPLPIDNWQFSLQSAIGLQARIHHQWGIFIEPGIAYYINPYKDDMTETIRSVRPITFNLQVGVRLSY